MRSIALMITAGLMMGASCGDTKPTSQPQPPTEGEESGSASAEGVDIPMPTHSAFAKKEQEQERKAPAITNLSEAKSALRAGFYDEVKKSLPKLGTGPAAKLVAARHAFATGRYDMCASLADGAKNEASLKTEALTLRGEALVARGKLEAAEKDFAEAAKDPKAFRALVMMGRLQARQGRDAEAQIWFMKLIEAYNNDLITSRDGEGLLYVALAAAGLGSAQDANDAFQQSVKADSTLLETQIEWAQVFMSKYDMGHAEESIRIVLKENPNHAVARALYARIKIGQSFDFAAAADELEKALSVNSELVMAKVTKAGLALRDLDSATADSILDRALQTDPNDLEVLSTKAAVRFLADDAAGFEKAKREVFKRNRGHSEMFAVIAGYAEWEHRYPELVKMSEEAVTMNPEDALGHATLGMNLLRMGEEKKGLDALRAAWKRDKFNVRVFNTLNFFDDVIPVQYESFTDGPFVYRMHKDEKPVLERYVPQTLGAAYKDMKKRYKFTPDGPVHIEMFNNPQHFAIRTVGLPAMGVQGVCFGKVVTALSPKAGSFNWGQITWHELAHVFHIQLSKNHVPRWFTEGLAEYETIIARPEWRREMDHLLWAALSNDELPKLRLMNQAFTHARSGQDMMTAYYASSRIVKYIAEKYGFDKVVAMLKGWASGKPSPEVIQNALGISIDDLDAAYRVFATKRLQARKKEFSVNFDRYRDLDLAQAAAKREPKNAQAQAELAVSQLVNGDPEAAEKAMKGALSLDGNNALALYLSVTLDAQRGEHDKALASIKKLLAAGKNGYDLQMLRARLAMNKKKPKAAKVALKMATSIDPKRSPAWQALLAIAKKEKDEAGIRMALSKIVQLEEHGRSFYDEWIALLAKDENWKAIADAGVTLNHLDPHNGPHHEHLGEAYLRTGKANKAVYEFDTALLLKPANPGVLHLGRARALKALGKRKEMSEAKKAAVAADPALQTAVDAM